MIKPDLTPYKLKATFYDNGRQREQFTDDRRYYERLISQHGHLSGLEFEPVSLSEDQQARLSDLKGSEIQAHLADAADYVRYGIVDPESDAPFLSDQVNDDDVQERTLEHHKDRRRDEARGIRWQHESDGVTVQLEDAGEITLRTDERSQQRVTGLVTNVLADEDAATFDFEYAPGQWMEVSRYDAIAIGKAVSGHVQSCFTRCKKLHALISDIPLAGNLTESLEALESIDLEAEWDALS